jgi:large subunit ribosomal protein L17
MRHRKSGRKLGRTWEHRKALMKNMARSLVEHERIRTTEAKAKELRILADKLITMALQDSVHARRQAYAVLGSHHSVKKLFDEIGPRFKEIPGGYTRVVKFGIPRVGDSAPMALIEFTRLSERLTGETLPDSAASSAE